MFSLSMDLNSVRIHLFYSKLCTIIMTFLKEVAIILRLNINAINLIKYLKHVFIKK